MSEGSIKGQHKRSASSSPLITRALETRGRHLCGSPTGVLPREAEAVPLSLLPSSTSEHRSQNNNKKNRNDDDEHSEVVGASITDKITATVDDCFSAVEIFFQLTGERRRGDALFPRDVGNLLLWSVPLAVPLIEGPKVFFLKNKSKLRDVVVIYVNGWTHDDMLLAGASNYTVDLASTDSAATENKNQDEKSPLKNKKLRYEDDVVTKAQNTHQWAERIGRAMLYPIRAQQCWARQGSGVQFAPLCLPGTRNSLEHEIFWRNDAPKAPRDGNRYTCTTSNITTVVEDEVSVLPDIVSVNNGDTALKKASSNGVGKLFNRALSIHCKTSPNASCISIPTAAKNASLPSLLPSPSSVSASPPPQKQQQTTTTTTAHPLDDDRCSLWGDRGTLLQYALSLEKDRELLKNLAFTVDVPSDDVEASKWASFDVAPPSDGNEPPRVFAFDCEMVLVANRVSALARITLLDVQTGCIVIDTLVNPETEVVDYLTRYSGVNQKMLEDVKTTLQDCQRELKRYVNTETFVVGHSLENDFKACKMLPNCLILDTAHLFPHPAGMPMKNSLRFLAMRYLHKRIQQGQHDSAVDAITSAELVYLKLMHGPSFGVRARVNVLELIENAVTTFTTTEAVVEDDEDIKHKGEEEIKSVLPTSFSSSTETMGIELNLFDDASTLREIIPANTNGRSKGLLQAVPVRHDRDAVRKVVRYLQRRQAKEGISSAYAMTWVQLTETVVRHKDVDGNELPHTEENESDEKKEEHSWGEMQLERVDKTNRHVMQIIRAVPHNSLVIVLAAGASPATSPVMLSDKARGVCFAFVKDDTSPGPPTVWLDEETTTNTSTTAATVGVKRNDELKTPPVCQQQ